MSRIFQAACSAALALGTVFLLGACTSGMTAAVASLKLRLPGGSGADALKLDPNFAYLRVTRGGYVTFVWRGSTERSAEGLVEVYYSGGGEVLRLRDGRLVGVSGLATEWRRVVDEAPPWSALLKAGK